MPLGAWKWEEANSFPVRAHERGALVAVQQSGAKRRWGHRVYAYSHPPRRSMSDSTPHLNDPEGPRTERGSDLVRAAINEAAERTRRAPHVERRAQSSGPVDDWLTKDAEQLVANNARAHALLVEGGEYAVAYYKAAERVVEGEYRNLTVLLDAYGAAVGQVREHAVSGSQVGKWLRARGLLFNGDSPRAVIERLRQRLREVDPVLRMTGQGGQEDGEAPTSEDQ